MLIVDLADDKTDWNLWRSRGQYCMLFQNWWICEEKRQPAGRRIRFRCDI